MVLLILKVLPFKVLVTPRPDSLENREDGFSVIGDAVLNPRWDLGINLATDQALTLQRAERCGQDFVRNIRHEAASFVEAARAGIQPIKANQAPFAADNTQRRRKRTPAGWSGWF